MATAGQMEFRRYGRSHHLRIQTAADLEFAAELDEAHWVATNAPVGTINCDETFLRLLDSDDNGRITCQEVKNAIRWLAGMLTDRSGVTDRRRTLALGAVNDETDEGRRIREAARKILDRCGAEDAQEITLEQVRRVKTQVESMPVSEAGVVLPEAAKDAQVAQFITDVIAALGGTPHPAGAQGITRGQLEEFLAAAAAQLEWRRAGEVPPGDGKTRIMPLGADTATAYAALSSIRGKMDQYFAQCEAAALDERFVQRMGWTAEELQGLDFDDPAVIEQVLEGAPLARATPDRRLSFEQSVNPHYSEPLERFRRQVAEPVLGESGPFLTVGQWRQIKAAFAEHEAWVNSQPAPSVGALGAEKLQTYLDERFARAVGTLIAESSGAAVAMDNIRLTEKLILFQANMMDLANNFVSFPHLYDPASRAVFEMGTLVMDGRRFNLAVKVDSRTQHAKVAKSSNMYVLYAEVAPAGGAKYEVAAPVTSGGKGNLCLAKRGVFRDLFGREHDATIVHIIENPISLREALVSPFRRLGKLLSGKIESITAQAEKKLDASATGVMSRVAPVPGAAPQASRAPSGLAAGGMLMGAGVALAALGSAVAYIAKTLAALKAIQLIIVVVVALLVVLVPTSIVASLKLRRRDLSAILEGSGWGINARMRMTRKQRRFFTQRPAYPRGAKGVRRVWLMLIVAAVVLAILAGGGYLLRMHMRRQQPPASQPAARPVAP